MEASRLIEDRDGAKALRVLAERGQERMANLGLVNERVRARERRYVYNLPGTQMVTILIN